MNTERAFLMSVEPLPPDMSPMSELHRSMISASQMPYAVFDPSTVDLVEAQLPGGIVKQTTNHDCFLACVSMLTGIDLELLSPLIESNIYLLPLTYVPDRELMDWSYRPWLDLFDHNGYTAKVWKNRPPNPSIAFGFDPLGRTVGHAMVVLPDDLLAEPGSGQVLRASYALAHYAISGYMTIESKVEKKGWLRI